MNTKKLIKELKKQLRKEKDNLGLKLQLASACQEAGELADAVEQYCEVARFYYESGQLANAHALCQTALGLMPMSPDALALAAAIEQALRKAAPRSEPRSEIDDSVPQGKWVPTLARPRAGEPSPARAKRASDPNRPRGKLSSLRGSKSRISRPSQPMPQATAEPPRDSDRSSFSVATPTPLPAPLAPHEADEDSVIVDGMPRYKLPISEPSGPLPRVSLPGDIAPVELEVEDLLPVTPAPEILIARPLASPPARNMRGSTPLPLSAPGRDETLNDFEDDDEKPTQLTDPRKQRDRARLLNEPAAWDAQAMPDIGAPGDDEQRMTLPDPPRSPASTAGMAAKGISPLGRGGAGERPGTTPGRLATNNAMRAAARPDPLRKHDAMPLRAKDSALLPDVRPAPAAPVSLHDTQLTGTIAPPGEWDEDTTNTDDKRAAAATVDDSLGPVPLPDDGRPVPIDIEGDLTTKVPARILGHMLPRHEPDSPAPPQRSRAVIVDDEELGPSPRQTRRGLAPVILDDEAGHELGTRGFQRPLAAFGALPAAALEDLAERARLRQLAAGQYIIRESEPSHACFAIVSGQVSVLRRDEPGGAGEILEVARLGGGELVGELAFLPRRYRAGGVRAVGDCQLYEIPRRLLRELAANHADAGQALDHIYRERVMASVLRTCPYFSELLPAQREALRMRFQTMRCEGGERIVREGRAAGGLYVVVQGSLEIIKRVSAEHSTILATVDEGSYVGEMALGRGDVASVTVACAGPAELAVLPAQDFCDIIQAFPGLWRHITSQSRRRELESNLVLVGDTAIV